MVNWKSRKLGDVLWFANGVVALVLINLLVSQYFFRLDLTEEKRYSIKPQTKEILNTLEDEVYVEIFLSGDLNAGFTRFQKAIQETLEEFRIYSHNKIKFRVTDPGVALSDKARQEYMADLAARLGAARQMFDAGDHPRLIAALPELLAAAHAAAFFELSLER